MGSTAITCALALIAVGLATPLAAEDLIWDSAPGDPGVQSDSGDWAQGGSNTNWQNGGGGNTNFDGGDTAIFSDLAGGSATITIQEDIAPGGITFASGGYTIDSADVEDRIEVHGSDIAINVAGGTSTIAAGISNKATITVGGGGTLVLSGTNIDEGSDQAGVYDVEDGTLQISGSTAAEDSIRVSNSDGTLQIAGGGSVGGSVDMTAAGEIENEGTIAGNVTLSDGEFVNGDPSGFEAGTVLGTVTLQGANAEFTNNQNSAVSGAVTVDNGTLNADGGSFGAVEINDGVMNINADTSAAIIETTGGQLQIDAGANLATTLNMNGGTTNNEGTMTGPVVVTNGTFNNGDTNGINPGTVAGDVNINGSAGIFNNNVASDVTGTVTLDDGDGDTSTGGTLNGNGGDFTDVVVNDGTFNVNDTTSAESVTNGGGLVAISGGGVVLNTDFDQAGGTTTIANGGTLDDTDGTVTVSDGVIQSQGLIDDAVAISGGEVQNNGGGYISGPITVSGGALTASGGTFGDNVTISDTGTLNVYGPAAIETTTITGGNIDVSDGNALATDLVQSGGTTTIDNGGILTDADGTTLDGGAINNGGTITNALTINDGIVTNNGTGVIGGVTTVKGGTLNASGGAFTGGILAQGGVVNVTVSQTLDLTNDGSDTYIGAGITLTDDVVSNDGTLTNEGTINGTVQVNGGTVNQDAGNITGLVTVTGTSPTETGALVLSGGSLDAGAVAQADGDIIVDGPTSGDITNDGGTVTVVDGGNLTGDLTHNSGATGIENNGTLTGSLNVNGDTVTVAGSIVEDAGDADAEAVTVNAGTLVTENGADIQVTTTQLGGTINANGGEFSGGIIGQGGELNIAGDVGGDISVEGSVLAVTGTGTLTGDVTMATGATTASNDGTITGAVFADNGTFQNNGTIEGDGASNAVVVSGGTFSNNSGGGAIMGEVMVSDGTFLANGGTTTGTALITGTGQYTVTANSSGNVQNGTTGGGVPLGGTVTINAGQTLTGDVTNNSGTTTVNGTINGALDVGGGTVTTNTGSQVTELATVSGGTLTANGGTFDEGILATGGDTNVEGEITITSGALTSDDGTVTIGVAGIVNGDVVATNSGGVATALIQNNGMIDGTATVGAGELENLGTLTGAGIVNGGELTNLGQMQDGFTINGGTLSLEGAGSITGAGTVNAGGTFSAAGGTFNDGVDNAGGVVEITGNATGVIRNNDGQASIDPGVTLTGNVINGADGTFNLETDGAGTGTIDGDLSNNGGIVNVDGTITGTTTNTAGGQITVANGDVANFGNTTGLTNTGGATLTIAGDATGSFTNTATGNFELTGGALSAGTVVNNAGQMSVEGVSTANGAIGNTGTLTVGGGFLPESLTVTGSLTNASGGTLEVAQNATLSASTMVNDGGGTVELRGRLDSAISNNGNLLYFGTSILDDPDTDLIDETLIDPADANRFGGLVTNGNGGNIILQSGRLTFGNGLANSGTVDASSGQAGGPQIGDVVEINGGLSGGGRFVLDLDLSEENVDADGTGASDYVTVTGAVTGPVTLVFNILDTGGAQENDILVFQSSTPGIDLTMEGLPDPGEAIVYVSHKDGAGSWFVRDALNPGIGALAGSIVLTQSLIGSVINRPSSPFVSGLAYDDPDPCGPGVWTRGMGGEADSSGQITELDGSSNSFDGEISADFWGIQGGGDLACFNGYFEGWDISIGGIGGFNSGSTLQPVFGLLDVDGDLQQGDDVTSITDVDFDQTYAGVYVTGALNRFSADLQFRLEQTDFVATNVGQNGSSGLGLTDETFSSDASTFSGSVSYAIPLGESSVTFVPTGGFAYTQVSTDVIDFDDGSSVQVEDFTSETVFVGGTLARTSFGDDGTWALSQFGTVTYYSDLADAPRSVFTPAEAADPEDQQEARSLETENLGAYAELSAGLNYIRILPLDAPGGAKQLSASLRGDLRSSDQLDSWGLTGQFRIQF